jgi:hypothetical protein
MKERSREESILWLAAQTAKVENISIDEAEKRVRRIANMGELTELGTPDTHEYRMAIDILMEIPSDEPITVESIQKIVNKRMAVLPGANSVNGLNSK